MRPDLLLGGFLFEILVDIESRGLCRVEGRDEDTFTKAYASLGMAIRRASDNAQTVRIDRETFRSALLNLLINATQAMEAGGQLMVRTRAAGLGVTIELIDTGPGMSRETLARVFEAFYSTKQGGSGLGLPTARKIVEAHGGTIDIESAPGRGTKVAIWLPAPPRLPTEPAAGH